MEKLYDIEGSREAVNSGSGMCASDINGIRRGKKSGGLKKSGICRIMPEKLGDGSCYIFGGMIVDYYYKITEWPHRGQDGFITGENEIVGGCAVNMAVTLKNLGVDACVISGLGNDNTADRILEYMNINEMSAEFLISIGGNTGKCLVFLEPDGERTFLTEKGAEGVFPEELDRKIRAKAPAAAGVTGYYLLDNDAERIMDCIEYIHGKGTMILFDPSPLVDSIDKKLLARMIAASDIITPNKSELEIIQRFTTIEEYCGSGRTAVVKSGGDGGTVYFGRKQEESVQIENFGYKAAECNVVDTTGAGDSFAGALLYAMLNKIPITESVKLASRCAAKTVEIEGPHGFWSLED